MNPTEPVDPCEERQAQYSRTCEMEGWVGTMWVLALKMEKGQQAMKCGQPLEAEGSIEVGSPLEPEGTQACSPLTPAL